MSLLLNFLYFFFAFLLLPFFFYKFATSPKYRRGLGQRLGIGLPRFPTLADRTSGSSRCVGDEKTEEGGLIGESNLTDGKSVVCAAPLFRSGRIWIHGVSVGEVLAARSLVQEIEKAFPQLDVVISTSTYTGVDAAKKTYPGKTVFYFPLDISWIVNATMKRVNPSAIILMEQEVWPNFMQVARRRGVHVVVVNGRMSKRAFERLRLVGPFVRAFYSSLSLCVVQEEEHAERFRQIGVPADRIRVAGSLKYDAIPLGDAVEEKNFRALFGIAEDARVIVGGSLHHGEEPMLVEVFQELKKEMPDLRLVIAPRYPERVEEIEALLRARGEVPVRRSTLAESPSGYDGKDGVADAFTACHRGQRPEERFIPSALGACSAGPLTGSEVIILDTIGELMKVYSIATVVFVGGSLVQRGGQNMLEPASLGKPTIFGPYISNFKESAALLLARGASRMVQDKESLFSSMREILTSDDLRERMGASARATVESCRGATRRTLDYLRPLLSGLTDAGSIASGENPRTRESQKI